MVTALCIHCYSHASVWENDSYWSLLSLTRPLYLRVHDVHVSVAHQLHVDGVNSLSVDEFVFVHGWPNDSNVRAVNAPSHIREGRHSEKFRFRMVLVRGSLELIVRAYPPCQHSGHTVHSPTNCGLAYNECVGLIKLERAGCKYAKGHHHCMSGESPPLVYAHSHILALLRTRRLARECPLA